MPRPSRFINDISSACLKRVASDSPTPAGGFMSPRMRPFNDFRPYSAAPAAASTGSGGNRGDDASSPAQSSPDVSEGMRIEHVKFGCGTIVSVDRSMHDVRIEVDFDNAGRKTLLLRFARFTIIG